MEGGKDTRLDARVVLPEAVEKGRALAEDDGASVAQARADLWEGGNT